MSNRFRMLRKEKGLSQIALQNAVHIDQSTLSRYETGERLPTAENLLILAEFYGVSTDFLLSRSDLRNPQE